MLAVGGQEIDHAPGSNKERVVVVVFFVLVNIIVVTVVVLFLPCTRCLERVLYTIDVARNVSHWRSSLTKYLQ